MRPSILRTVVLCVLVAFVGTSNAACVRRIWPSDVGVRRDKWLADSRKGNFARTSLQRRFEWPYNHPTRQSGAPGLCLALSGGGLRSASFAIGVLQGLRERGALREIDRASSVSGGGFALSWYLVHHFDASKALKDAYSATKQDEQMLASECSDTEGCRYQRELEGGMDIIANPFRSADLDFSTLQGVGMLLASVPAVVPNFVLNGVFGWHANTAPARAFYQARVEQVFHRPPGTLSSLPFYEIGRWDEVELGHLRRMLKRTRNDPNAHLPFPIFLTAANLNHSAGAASQHVANRLFEITPVWEGSDAFGYRRDGTSFDLHTAVAVSGAAVDSDISLSGPPGMLASALNLDLGYHVDNPLYPRSHTVYRSLPAPLYFFFGWSNNLEGARIHLTDGGHVENLGAFPLFRRLCRQTLIVDGSYDPNLGYDDYRALRDSLRGELGLELAVPAIDDWLGRQLAVARVLRAVKKESQFRDLDHKRRVIADLEDLHPVWESPIREAYCPPRRPDQVRGALENVRKAIRSRLERLHEQSRRTELPDLEALTPDMGWLLLDPTRARGKEGELWDQAVDAELMVGSVTGLEGPLGSTEAEVTMDVLYVKLGLPRAVRLDLEKCDHDRHSEAACLYREALRSVQRRSLVGDFFPYESSVDLSFEGEQFRAYRDLGRMMALRIGLAKERPAQWFNPEGTGWSYRPLLLDGKELGGACEPPHCTPAPAPGHCRDRRGGAP